MHGLDSESWCGEDVPHDRRPSQLSMVGAMFANRAELRDDYASDRRHVGGKASHRDIARTSRPPPSRPVTSMHSLPRWARIGNGRSYWRCCWVGCARRRCAARSWRIDMGRRRLRVIGKGGKERHVPVDPAFFTALFCGVAWPDHLRAGQRGRAAQLVPSPPGTVRCEAGASASAAPHLRHRISLGGNRSSRVAGIDRAWLTGDRRPLPAAVGRSARHRIRLCPRDAGRNTTMTAVALVDRDVDTGALPGRLPHPRIRTGAARASGGRPDPHRGRLSLP
jgi:hypothetical protein